MKYLLYSLLIPLSLYAQDALQAAIKSSNPRFVKIEINNRITQGKPFTQNEQIFYINFCEEVITRRRNAIQFPSYIQYPNYYYYGTQPILYYNYAQPVFTKAFTTDEEPEISFNCGVRYALGALGTIVALLYWQDSITNYKHRYSKTTDDLIITSGVISFVALCSALIEIDMDRKQHQEKLYENAIYIKNIFMNLIIVNTASNIF